ncbi:hypothetical protein [Sinomicrobium weinanense]|uniref:Uncharacterized protein n=1 Tax=Sinomicrobium weinanense TaxID=2842200 RepID=A0A926JSE8_9FLAO|nr:hypothetical protein [Sinomicrobium weinanense]MBC9796454.1 hypothetical protein [Sinomicrobium weinanense]MBU3125949.1 hypothetical protein [Sinomicrobium weinanense]
MPGRKKNNDTGPLPFETLLNNFRKKKDYSELPGIDIPMWPDDVVFQDDLGDERYYNDIFIEQRRDQPSGFRFFIKILFFMHNLCFSIILYGFISGKIHGFGDFWFFLLVPAMAWIFLGFEVLGARLGAVRFNRKTQMVYVGDIGGVVSLPWKLVKPFFNFGVHGGDLRFFFPQPETLFKNDGTEVKYEYYNAKEPFMLNGNIDWRDTGIDGSLLRLEFYRRYMEQGLDAVQPDPEKVDPNTVRPPSQAQQSHPDQGVMLYYVLDPLARLGGLLAGGPLIDWFLRRQAAKFKWPDEIERLCSPDADLSGIDTTPVKPGKNLFYRCFGLGGIVLVNAKAQRVG